MPIPGWSDCPPSGAVAVHPLPEPRVLEYRDGDQAALAYPWPHGSNHYSLAEGGVDIVVEGGESPSGSRGMRLQIIQRGIVSVALTDWLDPFAPSATEPEGPTVVIRPRVLVPAERVATWLEVQQPDTGEWVSLTDHPVYGDHLASIRVELGTPDSPVRRMDATLFRRADGKGIAPGLALEAINTHTTSTTDPTTGAVTTTSTFRPILYPGRRVRALYAILGATGTRATATRIPWWNGRVDDVDFAEDVRLTAVTPDAELMETRFREEVIREPVAPATSTPVEQEIQSLLNLRLGTAAPTLVIVGTPGWGVGAYKIDAGKSLGEQIRELAAQNAWDVRYLWDDVAGDWKLTLYLPPRDKNVPDMTVAADAVRSVGELSIGRKWVRNDFVLNYVDAAGNPQQVVRREQASIDEYGERSMVMTEDESSPIRDATGANNLLTYAANDLSQPHTTARKQIPFTGGVDLHALIRVEPDGTRYDFATDWSVVGGALEVREESAHTEVELRGGSPVGQFYGWHKRKGTVGGEGGEGAQPPVVTVVVGERMIGGMAKGIALITVQERGVTVTAVEMQEQIGDQTRTTLHAPQRGPGATSVLTGAVLAAGEYEQEVQLHQTRLAWIFAFLTLVSGERQFISIPPFDRNRTPDIISLDVTGNKAKGVGDSDTKSWLARRTDVASTDPAYWQQAIDGSTVTFTVPVPDGVRWNVEFVARSDPSSAVSVNTLTVSQTRMVGTVATTTPRWSFVGAFPPPNGDRYMVIQATPENLPVDTTGWSYRFWHRENRGSGWSNWLDITNDILSNTVDPIAPPHSVDASYFTSPLRNDSGSSWVDKDIRAELLDNTGKIVDSLAASTAWMFATSSGGGGELIEAV